MLYYIDDILCIFHTKNSEKFERFLVRLQERFQMRRMAEANWFLGIRITRDRVNRRLWLCQDSYLEKLAAKFHVNQNARLLDTLMASDVDLTPFDGQASQQDIYAYQQRVGSINFATTGIRGDVARTSSILSQFLQNLGPNHLTAADRAIEYLVGTKTLAIKYSACQEPYEAYSDAAFADNSDRKSSDGFLLTMYGGPVDWKASKQKTVTTSTTEAELLALSQTAKQVVLWNRILQDINYSNPMPPIRCDNAQTIRLLTEELPQLNTKLRHVDIHHHWLRQEVQDNKIAIKWCPTASMKADGLTKALTGQKFKHFVRQLNLVDIQDRLCQDSDRTSPDTAYPGGVCQTG